LTSTLAPATVEAQPLPPEARRLVRALGLWDVTAITAGTILGSAIFLAAAFVPRAVPHPTLALLLWVTGGLIAVAGTLTYAELGTMFPEAGGQYHYIRQAFGPLWGFLFGWTSLLAIQAGANAYLGVAFGEYVGAFLPFFSSTHAIASIPVGAWRWEPNTVQLAGVSAIAVLSVVNYFGAKQGARVQSVLTAIKLLSVAGLIGFGLLAPAKVTPDWTAPLPPGNLMAAMGLAIVAVLGNFDGWYQATLSAGEIKRPERNLPLGMIGGTVLIGVVYLLVNLVYFRALSISQIGASARIGEEATTALLGPTAGRLLAAAVLVSVFGCLSSAIIGASRLGLPMSEDAPACRWMARIHPRYQTPTAGIATLGLWSMLLVLTGSYEQLFQYSLFAGIIFHVITGLALFRLRRQRPHAPRPYRVVGYPWVPAVFVSAMTGLVLNTLYEQPVQSLLGIGLVAVGVPVYRWRRTPAAH
jgi:APA family basic amino acid/polyamine antiporter